jgi:CheY-like chemotaxis protein
MSSSSRVFFCPSCGARYDVARDLLADDTVVLLCGTCGHASRVGEAAVQVLEEPKDTESLRLLKEAQLPRVVVGHEVPAAARSIAQVLRAAGYAPACVRSGEQVLAACDPAMPSLPAAVILDVAIPGVLAFEVIEHLRAHPATKGVPVVLLASVFERTRYKRRPTNLYGADAYLELHHVPDRLGALIDEVRAHRAPASDRLQTPVERARGAGLRARPNPDDPGAARALARRLLSDVALYHGDEIAEGIRVGVPFGSLASAVEAARDLFRGACTAQELFEEELHAFSQQLLERGPGRAPAAGGGSAPASAAVGETEREPVVEESAVEEGAVEEGGVAIGGPRPARRADG